MKDSQKVYIKGVPDRGEEVIKALTDLGGKTNNLNGSIKDWIYFIDHDDSINFAHLSSETAKIIMNNYKEVKLPEKWRDGDILIWRDGDILICRDCKLYVVVSYICTNQKFFIACIQADKDNVQEYKDGLLCHTEDYCLATDKEVKEFYEILHKNRKDWDAEKKQLVDWKWRPKDGEDYYYIISNGIVHLSTWFDYKVDNSRFSIGNCFKTKEEAEIMAEKFIKLLKGKS